MRLNQILSEKIVNQPRNTAFLSKASAALRRLVEAVTTIADDIARLDKTGEGSGLLHWALNQSEHDLPSPYRANFNRDDGLKEISRCLDNIVLYGTVQHDFVGHALAAIGRLPWPDGGAAGLADTLDFIERRLVEYGFEPDQDYPDDAEIRDARRLIAAYRALQRSMVHVETVIGQVKPVLLDQQRRLTHRHRPEEYRPEHGEVETLFHASLFAREIAAEGFAAEKPQDRSGVGNYGNQKTISFTHDLRVAHDIMRAFREMWMIVHGQLSYRTIVGWLRHEGIDVNQAASYFTVRREAPDSVYNTMGLYRAYLGLTKLRANPLIVNHEDLLEPLRSRALSDIGIVSCPVDLRGETDYRFAEAEFRVGPDKVVGPIKRVV